DLISFPTRRSSDLWAGKGDFLRLKSMSARVNMFNIITGGAGSDHIRVDGLDVSLIRDENGRSNLSDSNEDNGNNDAPVLTDLVVTNSRFSFTDQKRKLSLEGPVSVNAKDGLRVAATGTFLNSKASFQFIGSAIAGIDPRAA